MAMIERRLLSPLFVIFILMHGLSGCSDKSGTEAQGYVEGRFTYIATSVSGVLKQLLVARGTQVSKGQVLYALEEEPESDAYNAQIETLKQAIAGRDALEATLVYNKLTFERYKILVPKNAIQQSELDRAKSNYDAALAQLVQAKANIAATTATLAQSKWTKDQKVGFAPVAGVVFDTYYRMGEYTQAQQAILSLLAPADIKAIFYVPQPDVGKLKLAQSVQVRCDGCEKWVEGHISFIAPNAEYTPPVIFSNDTNSKLIFRIEAEFAAKDAIRLHPGQPIRVRYD